MIENSMYMYFFQENIFLQVHNNFNQAREIVIAMYKHSLQQRQFAVLVNFNLIKQIINWPGSKYHSPSGGICHQALVWFNMSSSQTNWWFWKILYYRCKVLTNLAMLGYTRDFGQAENDLKLLKFLFLHNSNFYRQTGPTNFKINLAWPKKSINVQKQIKSKTTEL